MLLETGATNAMHTGVLERRQQGNEGRGATGNRMANKNELCMGRNKNIFLIAFGSADGFLRVCDSEYSDFLTFAMLVIKDMDDFIASSLRRRNTQRESRPES